MFNKTIVAALVAATSIFPKIAFAENPSSNADFDRCIYMAGYVDEAAPHGYNYDFSKVAGQNCESIILAWSNATPRNDLTALIIGKINEAISEGRFPSTDSPEFGVILVGEVTG